MEKESVDFQLSNNLKYTNTEKGDFETTATIIMCPPTMEVFDQATNISQLVMKAVTDVQERNAGQSEELKAAIEEANKEREESSKEGFDAEEIKAMLFSSNRVQFIQVANEFKRLAPSVCKVGEKIKLVPNIIKKMDINDYTNLICSYIANFITPSLL